MIPNQVEAESTLNTSVASERPAGQAINATRAQRGARSGIDYDERPMLVFWETTRSCHLACRHCRASATADALPGELSGARGRDLIDQVAAFGRPYPVLILTGGDCLLRADLFDLIGYAVSIGLPVALAPSVTPLLNDEAIARVVASGVTTVSVSLDAAQAGTHDAIRGVPGHFTSTVAAVTALARAGLTVQVNTTVMSANATRLADVAAVVTRAGARVWEVFFLVEVGRGTAVEAIGPREHEEICHFLYDVAQYGLVVRTVEAPFFRRVVSERAGGSRPPSSPRYQALFGRLSELLGPAPESGPGPGRSAPMPTVGRVRPATAATRDGKGIVFIAHDGQVYPAGFLPLPLGNVRDLPLRTIYRDNPLLRDIRAARFTGRCGCCEYADLCGGSRARAFAATGDPLGEDPACPYQPSG